MLCMLESVFSIGSMCKILYRAYYNFKSIAPLKTDTPVLLNSTHKLFYRLCTDFNATLTNQDQCNSEEEFGNIVLQDTSSGKTQCTNVFDTEKKTNKQVWKITHYSNHSLAGYYPDPLPNKDDQVSPDQMSGTAISYVAQTTNSDLNSMGVTQIAFGLICNLSLAPEQSIFMGDQDGGLIKNETLWFFYEGVQACGFDLIEPSVFMRNHIAFPITFIVLSVLAIILRRVDEQAMMAVSGLQFGMFITMFALANLELKFHYTESTTSVLFVCSCLMGVFFAFVCFISRNSSIFILFLGGGISLAYTILSIYAMIFKTGVSSTVFWIFIGLFVVVMVLLSLIPSFYDMYAHPFVVSIDFPFFISMSISTIVGWYPDLLTLRRAKSLYINLEVREDNWWFVVGQLLLMVALIIDSFVIARESMKVGSNTVRLVDKDAENDSSHEIHDRSM